MDKLKVAVGPLKSLYFILYTPFMEEIAGQDLEISDYGMDRIWETLEQGGMREFVGAAVNARILRIRCPKTDWLGHRVPLKYVIGEQYTFKELRWLSLTCMATTKSELVDLLHRHKHTLKHVFLGSIHLTEGTWQDTFEALAGILPHIHSFQFRGNLTADDTPRSVRWMGWDDELGYGPTRTSYAVDLFLRKGDGSLPVTLADVERYVPNPTYKGEPFQSAERGYGEEIDFPEADLVQFEEDMKEEEEGHWQWL